MKVGRPGDWCPAQLRLPAVWVGSRGASPHPCVSVDISGTDNWGRRPCICPRCPGEKVARTEGPGRGVGVPPPLHPGAQAPMAPCLPTVLAWETPSQAKGWGWEPCPPPSSLRAEVEAEAAHGQSPLGRGSKEMGLSEDPESKGGWGGTATGVLGSGLLPHQVGGPVSVFTFGCLTSWGGQRGPGIAGDLHLPDAFIRSGPSSPSGR